MTTKGSILNRFSDKLNNGELNSRSRSFRVSKSELDLLQKAQLRGFIEIHPKNREGLVGIFNKWCNYFGLDTIVCVHGLKESRVMSFALGNKRLMSRLQELAGPYSIVSSSILGRMAQTVGMPPHEARRLAYALAKTR